jgi:hypothetical protein
MKLQILATMLFILCTVCYADSDSTGVLRNSQERLIILLTNSTGIFDNASNCSTTIFFNEAIQINSAKMDNAGSGLYAYNWSVPNQAGSYFLLVNCTTVAKENYTAGGSILVVDRLLERAVASGVVRYSPAYAEQYETPVQNEAPILNLGWFNISLGAGVLLIIVLLLYNAYSKR